MSDGRMGSQEVEMRGEWQRGELCVVVKTPGPFQDRKVRCTRVRRKLGQWYGGRVKDRDIVNTLTPSCDLVGGLDAFWEIPNPTWFRQTGGR